MAFNSTATQPDQGRTFVTFRPTLGLMRQIETIAERDAVSLSATIRRLLARAVRSEQTETETR
jgi:hypothetical protein